MPDRPWNRSMASDPWRVLDVVVVGGRKVKIAIVAVLLFALMASKSETKTSGNVTYGGTGVGGLATYHDLQAAPVQTAE